MITDFDKLEMWQKLYISGNHIRSYVEVSKKMNMSARESKEFVDSWFINYTKRKEDLEIAKYNSMYPNFENSEEIYRNEVREIAIELLEKISSNFKYDSSKGIEAPLDPIVDFLIRSFPKQSAPFA